LQAHLRRIGIAATVCELNGATATVTVHSNSVVDWLLAKAELRKGGLVAVESRKKSWLKRSKTLLESQTAVPDTSGLRRHVPGQL
jgi:hypothetical protein